MSFTFSIDYNKNEGFKNYTLSSYMVKWDLRITFYHLVSFIHVIHPIIEVFITKVLSSFLTSLHLPSFW